MFGNKRLAKRSIVGTRVSALWQDGRYYPGIIQSEVADSTPSACAVYNVRFDDGVQQNVKASNIIGPGFQSVTAASLKNGQKAFITLNGREVWGLVRHHDRDFDEVFVSVKMLSGEDFEITKRLEEVRLLESRKSARLADQDTDYSKLADLQLVEPKRRSVSHVIDVPTSQVYPERRHRRQRHSSSDRTESDYGDFDEVEMMDETIAAMVLTSLSVSPKSPPMMSSTQTTELSQFYKKEADVAGRVSSPATSSSHLSSSVASSGFHSGLSDRDDHSPPLPPLSESAPAFVGFEPSTHDSDYESSRESGRLQICEEEESTVYKCTWRGCGVTLTTNDAILRHIRREHFNRDSDLEMSDDEEEFHYTEVEVSMDTMTNSFAAMTASSPTDKENRTLADSISNNTATTVGSIGVFDHDYQRKVGRQVQASSLPSGGGVSSSLTSSIPISIPEGQIRRTLSWQIHDSSPGHLVSPPSRSSKPTPQERLQQHQAQSPKSGVSPTLYKPTSHLKMSVHHRRPRSDVRKCRKVYGMENRDQWCTQCKWKKACTRFID